MPPKPGPPYEDIDIVSGPATLIKQAPEPICVQATRIDELKNEKLPLEILKEISKFTIWRIRSMR